MRTVFKIKLIPLLYSNCSNARQFQSYRFKLAKIVKSTQPTSSLHISIWNVAIETEKFTDNSRHVESFIHVCCHLSAQSVNLVCRVSHSPDVLINIPFNGLVFGNERNRLTNPNVNKPQTVLKYTCIHCCCMHFWQLFSSHFICWPIHTMIHTQSIQGEWLNANPRKFSNVCINLIELQRNRIHCISDQ